MDEHGIILVDSESLRFSPEMELIAKAARGKPITVQVSEK